jgi:hypothetical protein
MVSGCAVGSNFRNPAVPAIDGYTRSPLTDTRATDVPGGEAQRFVPGQGIPAAWWTLFQSAALNALIERASTVSVGSSHVTPRDTRNDGHPRHLRARRQGPNRLKSSPRNARWRGAERAPRTQLCVRPPKGAGRAQPGASSPNRD